MKNVKTLRLVLGVDIDWAIEDGTGTLRGTLSLRGSAETDRVPYERAARLRRLETFLGQTRAAHRIDCVSCQLPQRQGRRLYAQSLNQQLLETAQQWCVRNGVQWGKASESGAAPGRAA